MPKNRLTIHAVGWYLSPHRRKDNAGRVKETSLRGMPVGYFVVYFKYQTIAKDKKINDTDIFRINSPAKQ